MQYPDPPKSKEVQTTSNIQLQSQTEFTVKPTGEISVKGNVDPEIIRQLLTSTDYHKDQDRCYGQKLKSQQTGVEMQIVFFMGATFLVAIICLFFAVNQRNQNQGASNNGEFLRGINCSQIR